MTHFAVDQGNGTAILLRVESAEVAEALTASGAIELTEAEYVSLLGKPIRIVNGLLEAKVTAPQYFAVDQGNGYASLLRVDAADARTKAGAIALTEAEYAQLNGKPIRIVNGAVELIPLTPHRVVMLRQFFDLFTRAELLDIHALREAGDDDVTHFWMIATLADRVDLLNADTVAGVQALLSKNSPRRPGMVLTSASAAAVLAGTPAARR